MPLPRRSANRGTPSDGVVVLAARVFASQSRIPFAVRRVGRFCFVWTTPTYRRLQRRGTLLRLTYRLPRGGGIYTGGISSQKIRMARVCSMSLFAVKRCCHRAAECKSVSDICRQKVFHTTKLSFGKVLQSSKSLCMSRLPAAPVECREQALLLFVYADVCGAAVAAAAALAFCLSQRFDVRGRAVSLRCHFFG